LRGAIEVNVSLRCLWQVWQIRMRMTPGVRAESSWQPTQLSIRGAAWSRVSFERGVCAWHSSQRTAWPRRSVRCRA
jgi:hypothetical protein